MGPYPSPDTYDELVRLCYEPVLEAGRWPRLLNALARATGRQFGAVATRQAGLAVAAVADAPQCDPLAAEAYGAPYGAFDSPSYYPEFQRPPGVAARAAVKLNDAGPPRYMALLTAIDAEPAGEHEELLLRITPHLQLASQMYDAMAEARAGLLQQRRMLDALPAPMWLLDDTRRVTWRNAAAERYAARPQSAVSETNGLLRPHTTTPGRLDAAVRQALGQSGPARGTRIAPSTEAGAEILITPLPPSHPGNTRERPLAAVRVIDADMQNQHMAELFQFSRAEARLAARLQEGMSLAECAQAQGVALSTIRTQLRALFTKTGTHRQGELVSLLLRLSRN